MEKLKTQAKSEKKPKPKLQKKPQKPATQVEMSWRKSVQKKPVE